MKLGDRLLVFSEKLSSQPHLSAIRNGFFQMMPLILAGSFFVLLNNVILNIPIFQGNAAIAEFKNVGDAVYRGTLGVLSLLASFLTAYHLAGHYKQDGLISGAVSFGCLIAILPGIQKIHDIDTWGVLTFSDTSASGLFVAMLIAILSVEVLRFLISFKPLLITMPDSVPPAIAKSFNVLIPVCLTISIFGLVGLFFKVVVGAPLNMVIAEVIQKPIVNIIQTPWGIGVVLFLQNLLWAFGLHGAFILGPITEPTYLAAIQQNIDLIQQGGEAVNIITKPFIDSFTLMGGGGNTIGLVIALFLFSKRENERIVGKIGFLPGLFNINEPLVFGLPIVLNPIYGIPLVLVPLTNAAIAYFATYIGLVNKTIVLIPWTTPPIISAYLSTGGDWRAALLAVFLVVLSVIIYTPFVLLSNKVGAHEFSEE
ncbi:MAG: PTS sugar transporter subunit IIC [Brevinema sp.]